MLKIAIGVPWIVGLALLLPAIRPQTYPLLLVLVSAAAVWLEGLFTLLLVAFKTILRNNITAWLLAGSRGAIFLITGLLIWVDVDAPLAFALIRLGTGAVLVAIAILSLPFRVRFGSAPDLRQTWVNARPFAISDLFTSVYVQADVTIAALSLSQEAVGLYTPASSMVNALFVFPSALYSVAVPVLVRVLNAAQPRQAGTIRRAFLLAMLVFGALGGMLWLGLRIGAEPVATVLLGRDFARSGGLLAILSPIIFLKSCSFALAAMLVSVGWQRRRVYAQALSALVNVGLNVALIRRFGITGVATIYVLSEGLLMLGYLLLVLRWMSSSDSRYQIHRGA
jgi:O-antigen/teichoic acid export membrane protein